MTRELEVKQRLNRRPVPFITPLLSAVALRTD